MAGAGPGADGRAWTRRQAGGTGRGAGNMLLPSAAQLVEAQLVEAQLVEAAGRCGPHLRASTKCQH